MKRTALPPRRTPIRKVSTKRQRELREYSQKRKAFLLAHPVCQVWLDRNNCSLKLGAFLAGQFAGRIPLATDIHHKAGRTGWRLNDESQWLAVSREAHRWIHDHPAEARANGWLV